METEINKLRRLNIIAGTLHLLSLAGILLLSNDAALPVNATYLTEAPGTGNFSAPINLFNLNISYMVAAFLALSAFFHFSSAPNRRLPSTRQDYATTSTSFVGLNIRSLHHS